MSAKFSQADEFGNINVTGMGGSAHGSSAASIESMVVANTMKAVSLVESQLDAELNRLENLDENDLISLRNQRMAQLKARAEKEKEWKQQGHGQYDEIADEKQWFEENKCNDRVITHFFRASTWRCQLVDKHLTKLAQKHPETRFIKIDAEKSPFLAQRLQIVLMPTIVCTKNNKVSDMIEGFDSLGATDDFTTQTMEVRLAKNGAIDVDETIMLGEKKNKENSVLAEKSKNIRKGTGAIEKKGAAGLNFNRRVAKDEDEEDDDDDD